MTVKHLMISSLSSIMPLQTQSKKKKNGRMRLTSGKCIVKPGAIKLL